MQQIIRHLFKAESLDDVPRRRLEELVEEHPSFSVGHYLLSKKLKAEQADHFLEETRRTNLYFSNPLWLLWMLEERGEEKAWPPRVETQELPLDDRDIPAAGDGALIAMGEVADFGGLPDVAEGVEEPATVAEFVVENVEYPAEDESSEETVSHAPIEEWHFQESLNQPEVRAEGAVRTEGTEQTEGAVRVEGAEQAEGEVRVEQAEEPLVFQSYHTIDYFASQGIKLSLDENQNPSDRLGRQLKSFTEWLKVMKKLPKKEEDVTPDAISEQKIQAIAAHSNEGREVLTETMAEVLAKQGMWQKAAEVYRKLSLLNPEKSAYFAGLIGQMEARSNEQLNSNSL
jgi:hypothetical protein